MSSQEEDIVSSSTEPQGPAVQHRSALFFRMMKNVTDGLRSSPALPTPASVVSSTQCGGSLGSAGKASVPTSSATVLVPDAEAAALARFRKRRAESPSNSANPPVNREVPSFAAPLIDLASKFSRLKSPTRDPVPAESVAQPMQVEAVRQDDESVRSVRTLNFDDATSVQPEAAAHRQEATTLSTVQSRHERVPFQNWVPFQAAGTQPVVNGQNNQMTLVPFVVAGIKLGVSKRTISKQAFTSIKEEQRSTQCMWNSKWACPAGDIFERHSLAACQSFLCLGISGCEVGDCAFALQTHDIWEFRTRTAARLSRMREHGVPGRDATMHKLLHGDLWPVWNGTQFGRISVQLSQFVHAELCPAAYALVIGASGGCAQAVLSRIRRGEPPELLQGATGLAVPAGGGLEQADTDVGRTSLDAMLLQQYIEQHILKSEENNPAPGASRTVETVVNTKSWKAKFDSCQEHFRQSQNVNRRVGSMTMFKKIWERETRLKEKRAMSHSKCDICKAIDVELHRLRGVPGEDAARRRTFLFRARREHEQRHLSCRSILDAHGFQAVTNPAAVWCIQCDAATARNMELPRLNTREHRLPKKAAGTLPKFCLKLTATYCYGYGFIPFLSHDSLRHGPNLVWTVVWKSICRLHDHYGSYPDVLFILLDNTTGENKTNVMLAMASWLVATKRVKQVRVFFLMVGHTHVLIDQIFGVITVNIRGKEILLPERLMSHIDAALVKCPQYEAQPVEWLHSLWDFWDWTKQMDIIKGAAEGVFKRPELTDEHGKYNGMNDFIFTWNKEQLALCQYREHHEFPLRPEGSAGIPVIRALPTSPPRLVNIDPFSKWGMAGSKTIQNTVATYLSISTKDHTVTQEKYVTETWNQIIKDIPVVVELLKPEHKLIFEHFDWSPATPMLNYTGGDRTEQQNRTEQDDEETEYRAWCSSTFAANRDVPFAFDPVVSKEQSATAYQKKRAAYEAALLGGTGPTTSRQSLVLGGKHLFAQPKNQGVSLWKIEDIGRLQTPRSADPRLTCSRYDHTPAEGVSGFFGTFKHSTGVSKVVMTRDDVLVYNVEFLTKTRMVSLESLRALSLCRPLEYPLPDRVPHTHLPDSDTDSSDDSVDDEFDFRVPTASTARGSNQKGAAAATSSKEKGTSAKQKGQGTRSSSVPAPARKQRSSGTEQKGKRRLESSSSSSDEDEEEDASISQNSTSDEESNAGEEDGVDTTPDLPPQGPPALRAPADFCPAAGTLAFVCMEDDLRTYPIDLVYVESVESGSVKVRWFGSINLTHAKLSAGKNVTFQKHWNEKNKKVLETKLGLRNLQGALIKPKHDPTKAEVALCWTDEIYSASDGVFVPVLVQSKNDVTHIWKCNCSVTLTGDFLKNTLLPALLQLAA